MRISFVLVHNKGAQGNIDQITALKAKLTTIHHTQEERDENGVVIGVADANYYEFTGITISHVASIFQIIPFGVTSPSGYNDIESRSVYYGNGDEDKTGEHPRFFNWGLKRGTEYQISADVIIYILDVDTLTAEDLETQLDTIATDLLISTSASVMVAGSVYLDFGLLDESLTFANAISDLDERIHG